MSLADFSKRLRRLSAEEHLRSAAVELAAAVGAELRAGLAAHVDTGRALASARVEATATGIRVVLEDYARYLRDVAIGRGFPPATRAALREGAARHNRAILGGS